MSSQSQRFARQVLAAFEEAGRVTDQEVNAAGGPSSTTMTKLRKAAAGEAEMGEPRGDVHRRIDAAARWRDGSSRGLWRRGVMPQPLESRPGRVLIETSPLLDEKTRRLLLAAYDEMDPPPPTTTDERRSS